MPHQRIPAAPLTPWLPPSSVKGSPPPPCRVPGLPRRFDVWESCRRYAEIKRPGAFCEYVTGVE